VLEIIMRFFPIVLFVGITGASVATSVSGQKADHQISPRSVALQKQGQAALAAGQFASASDALETALAVDPRNRGAFIDLARVAERQKLYGKAIRLTNKALLLEPNDADALALQGQAMVELGATARAKETLVRLQKVCARQCPQLSTLSSAIARGPTVAAAKPVPASPAKAN
jgi:Tfp pilus assembly protein PilF